MKYTKLISSSEARYYINKGENEILKTVKNSQGSYNLPSEFLEAAREKNILVQDPSIDYARKSTDGDAFVLSKEYKFKLGKGALWLIGEDYSKVNNKFIASINASNGKFQLYRTVYKKFDSKEYEWFIALIDNNLAGNELILDIDEENQILTLDVKFNVINQGIDRSEIESEEDDENNEQEINNDFELDIEHPHNRIVFGAPGTGKSNRLENDKVVFGQNFERVTFHPNYSYAQFVGTYKPVPVKELVNGVETTTITYKYVPGPFMRTYVKAIRSIKENNPKPYLLLIEEINRANVAAVFGDVFQLLDRANGQSEYEIETSEDMRAYLAQELKGKESDYERIRIPKNMYLWATMNSADQGVFPMDTAFKRRWNFEYIGINENSEGIKNWIIDMCNEASLFAERVANYDSALSDIFTVFESEEAEIMLSNLLSILGEIWGTVQQISLRILSDAFNFVTQPIIDNTEKIKETLLNLFDFIGGVFENIRLIFHSVCSNILKLYDEHIRSLIQSLTDSLSEWYGIILDGWNKYISPVLKNLNEKFKEVIENYIIPFIDKLGEKLGVVIDVIKVLWENAISPMISFLLQNAMPVLGFVLEIIGDIAIVISKTLFAALNFILDPIEGVKNAFSTLIDIGENVLNTFFDIGEGIASVFSNIGDTVKNSINSVIGFINKMIDSINKFSVDIPNPFGGNDKHIGFNIPHIPALSNGGYVSPNSPQLAVIGDNKKYGEIVANDKQLSDLGSTIINGVVGAIGAVAGGTQPIYLTVQLGEDDITDIVAISADKYQKRTGKRIF